MDLKYLPGLLYVQILGCQLNPNVSEIAQIDKFQEVHPRIPKNEKNIYLQFTYYLYFFSKSESYNYEMELTWFFKQFLSQSK